MGASTRRIVQRAVVAAYVAATAGLAATVTIILFFSIGDPWGTLNDVALLAMTAAIPVLMLAFWELGGLTPTPLALAAQVSGWIAVIVWCVIHALFIAGIVDFDYERAATGSLAFESVALVVIGLWIAGANLLAGPWLNAVRWFGVVAGLGFALLPIGLMLGGVNHPLTYAGGVGYSIVFPVWAFLMGRHLSQIP
ncbi:MAG TPA: hypothetical protein VL687_06480 [Methylomirabilota bacterium]|nr:hypothetical protein [Methylomirabilota bacterium]